jgi:EAL domain-containing protein (putative c-di-GMP-specific phosphodiesterase class I)
MQELNRLARGAAVEELHLELLSDRRLRDLAELVNALWSEPDLEPDGAEAIRFEWLAPLIAFEQRRRISSDAVQSPIPVVPPLSTVFQPVVDLRTGTAVAYEALTRRGPEPDSEFPQALFDTARRAGRIVDLDRECWHTTLRSATTSALDGAYSLLINVEPESFQSGLLTDLPPASPVVVELTERALLSSPGELLAMVEQARAQGHAIAIDDLGANPASLALVPLIDPDVVKLDMRLIQARPDAEIARVMSALNTHASTTDVVIIAEGVETAKHVVTAQALGATHAQGWHFGRPTARVPDGPTLAGLPITARATAANPDARSPFEVVTEHIAPRSSHRALLVQMSIFLEARARASGDSAVVISTFQHASNVTPGASKRYLDLAEHCALVMIHVDGPTPTLDASPIHVAPITAGDALLQEWDIVVLTADFAAVLVARETDPSRHAEGVYEFVLSHDRALAVAAARHLIHRTASGRARAQS